MLRFRLDPVSADEAVRILPAPQGTEEPESVIVGKRFNSLKERNPLEKEEKVSLVGVIVGAVLAGLVAWFVHRTIMKWREKRRAERLARDQQRREAERRKALGLAPPRVYSLRAGAPALTDKRTPRDLLRVKLPSHAVVFDASEGAPLVDVTLDRIVVPGFHLQVPSPKTPLPTGDVFLARREAGGEVTVYPVEVEAVRAERAQGVAAGKLDMKSPSLRFLRHGRLDCQLRATLAVTAEDADEQAEPVPLEVEAFGLQSAVVHGPQVLGEERTAELLIAFPHALEASRFTARLAPPEVGEPTHASGTRLLIEAATDHDLFEAARFLALQNMEVNEFGGDRLATPEGAAPVAGAR